MDVMENYTINNNGKTTFKNKEVPSTTFSRKQKLYKNFEKLVKKMTEKPRIIHHFLTNKHKTD